MVTQSEKRPHMASSRSEQVHCRREYTDHALRMDPSVVGDQTGCVAARAGPDEGELFDHPALARLVQAADGGMASPLLVHSALHGHQMLSWTVLSQSDSATDA